MNFKVFVAVLGILSVALISGTQSAFFPLPGLGNLPGNSGGLPNLTDILNCQPINRTFVQHGLFCRHPNLTAINCQNQTCVCTSLKPPTLPNLPGGGFQLPSLPPPFSGLPSLPGMPGGLNRFPSISIWNCTNATQNPIQDVVGGLPGLF